MPRGVKSEATVRFNEQELKERQLAMALSSYERMKDQIVKALTIYKTASTPQEKRQALLSARESRKEAEHARSVAARHKAELPELPMF